MSGISKISMLNEAVSKAKVSTPARERLLKLFDEGSFTELDAYTQSCGQAVGVVIGYGTIEGSTVFAFSQDSSVNDGAVGRIHAAKIKKVYDLAVKTGAPVVGVYDSNGADLKEGSDALTAYGDMLLASNNISGVVPQISVVLGTCASSAAMVAASADFVVMSKEATAYGDMLLASNNISGVVPQISVVLGTCASSAAMVAASADFVVMSKEAQLFMTAPFTVKANGENTEGAGSAENAAKSGVAHFVEDTEDEAVAKARAIVSMLPINNLSTVPLCEFNAVENASDYLRAACENISSTDVKEIIGTIVDANSVVEIQKDFANGAFAALATLGGFTVGVAATVSDTIGRDECAKIARLVSICDSFQIPVITFVNTQGFEASAASELAGLVRESAKLAHVYAEATTPKVSVITGDAFGPAYIALAGRNANADVVLAWPSAVVSPLNPKTAVAIMYENEITAEKSREDVENEYRTEKAGALNAAADGIVDDVIDPAATRDALIGALDMLEGKRVSKLPKKHSNMPL